MSTLTITIKDGKSKVKFEDIYDCLEDNGLPAVVKALNKAMDTVESIDSQMRYTGDCNRRNR